VTCVLVLKMRITVLPRDALKMPVSSAYIVSAADMLPQLTLQSIADLSAASWASVLVMSASEFGERSTMNTLLLVDGPRPRPVVCRLPLASPDGGTPMIQRMA